MNFTDEQIKQIKFSRTGERFKDGHVYMEGCVIKPLHNQKVQIDKKTSWWQNCAKFVAMEFLDEFDEDSHWTSHRARENKLSSWDQRQEISVIVHPIAHPFLIP